MKKIVFLIALVLFTGVFYLSYSNTFASTALKPWDVTIEFIYDNNKIHYVLSKNINLLTKDDIQKRQIYCGAKIKAAWIEAQKENDIPYFLSLCYLFPGLENFIQKIQKKIDTPPLDAKIVFHPNSMPRFTYSADTIGRQTDIESLSRMLVSALKTGSFTLSVFVPVLNLQPKFTLEEAKNTTILRSSFETDCSSSTFNRQANIALALSFFNGLIVTPKTEVSFNNTVGHRTAERGFKTAKILSDGKYIEGVGGGVCQASTTLFNALVLADVQITKLCQHSSKSSYIEPSFDAMVNSGSGDLGFVNNTERALYFAAGCINGRAKVEIYGIPNEYKIVRRSVIKQVTPYKTYTIQDYEGKYSDKVLYVDQRYVLQHGAEGTKSEGYLDYYKDGVLVFSRFYRKNEYRPIDEIDVVGVKKRPKEPNSIPQIPITSK